MVFITSITSLLVLATSLSFSQAKENEAYAPVITYPDKWAAWKVNERHHASWETTNIPKGTTSGTGIYLVHDGLIQQPPLIQDFDLGEGYVYFWLPSDIQPGYYQLNVFGDSGDWSPVFQIIA